MNSALWSGGRVGKAGSQPQILFAQVREDAAVELELLKSRSSGERVFCIASGGCTAFSLLLARPAQLQIVDVNPAQILLVELKRVVLLHLPYEQMMHALLADAQPFYEPLRSYLSPAAQQFWDDHPHLFARGLNQCGVIEQRLRQVMRLLPLVQSRRNVRRLFSARSLNAQRHAYRCLWDHWRWALAFEIVLSKPILSLVYDRAFVRAVPPRFATQIKQRMDEAFLSYPLWENGYLWQTFCGVYPNSVAGLPPYLQHENHQTVQDGLQQTQLACADAALWLEAQEPNSIGFFALSNILEMTSSGYSKRLLGAVARAAAPGACVCLRSIFPFDDSRIEQTSLGGDFCFEDSLSELLKAKDRSVFCKNLRALRVLKD